MPTVAPADSEEGFELALVVEELPVCVIVTYIGVSAIRSAQESWYSVDEDRSEQV